MKQLFLHLFIWKENKILRNKAGIYCFINTVNNKLYIRSAKDLYLRLIEHLANKKSNSALLSAILKYGLHKFDFCVYLRSMYFTYHSKIVSNKALTDLETSYIKKYPFDNLYNFMRTATSLEGYKHTDQAKLKMLKRFENKSNHPMYVAHLFFEKKKLSINNIVKKQRKR